MRRGRGDGGKEGGQRRGVRRQGRIIGGKGEFSSMFNCLVCPPSYQGYLLEFEECAQISNA